MSGQRNVFNSDLKGGCVVPDLASEVDEPVERRGLAVGSDAGRSPTRDALYVQHASPPTLLLDLVRSSSGSQISRYC